jgi:hypothetical protein
VHEDSKRSIASTEIERPRWSIDSALVNISEAVEPDVPTENATRSKEIDLEAAEATTMDTEMSSVPTLVAPNYEPPELMPEPKHTLWRTIRTKARQDPLAVLGVLAGVTVLPFVIRGATKS